MEVPCPSPLDTHPPESGEGPVHPLKALVQSFEVTFTAGWILWVFSRVGQRHEDDPPFEGLECTSVDASQAPEEVPAACLGEIPYPISNTTTATPMRTELVLNNGILEGECGYRPSYCRGKVGIFLM
jgi:hypothetical protein